MAQVINTEKFKSFLRHEIEIDKKSREAAVKKNNYNNALEYDQELKVYEFLLYAFDDPDEHAWIEEAEDDN